jgi:hypothetical protein
MRLHSQRGSTGPPAWYSSAVTLPFAVDPAAPSESATEPAEPRAIALSGIASIDRVLGNPHPIVARYHRGEATDAELLQVPGMDEDSGVTMEETVAWLRSRGAKCAPTG